MDGLEIGFLLQPWQHHYKLRVLFKPIDSSCRLASTPPSNGNSPLSFCKKILCLLHPTNLVSRTQSANLSSPGTC